MFGFLKRKKYVPDPEHYPLGTCRDFYQFVKDNLNLTDAGLVDKIYTLTTKDVKAATLFDLIQVTRNELQQSHEYAERVRRNKLEGYVEL